MNSGLARPLPVYIYSLQIALADMGTRTRSRQAVNGQNAASSGANKFHRTQLLEPGFRQAYAPRPGGITNALDVVWAMPKLQNLKTAWMQIALGDMDVAVSNALAGVLPQAKLQYLKSAWMRILSTPPEKFSL